MSDFGLFLHRHAELFLGLSLIVNGVLAFRWFLEMMEQKSLKKTEEKNDEISFDSFETFAPSQSATQA